MFFIIKKMTIRKIRKRAIIKATVSKPIIPIVLVLLIVLLLRTDMSISKRLIRLYRKLFSLFLRVV